MYLKNYDCFVEDFSKQLDRNHPDVCFYVYGSFARGDYNSESDINGGIILDSEVIADKKKIKDISMILGDCLNLNPVEIQFNLQDRESNKDGRFLSYTKDYTEHIKGKNRIYSGPDFVNEMNGLQYKSGPLTNAGFVLRNARNKVLESTYYGENNRDKLLENCRGILKRAVKFPKHIVWLKQGEVETDKRKLIEIVKQIIPFDELNDFSRLDIIMRNFKNLSRNASDSQINEWNYRGLEAIEKMIQAYIREFPKHTEREYKN